VGANQPIHVALELDPLADPIAGRVRAEQGDYVASSGWLELISTLERLCTQDITTGESN
jgi:hypothetical protein